MVIFPNAKLNLGLFVAGKRPDGYHNIHTILYPIPVHDALEVIHSPNGKFSFSNSGIPVDVPQNDNLVVKAWRLLRRDFDLSPVHMHLHKSIPMGAGLGGGSADAACVIKLLNQIFKLDLQASQMEAYAAQLGMDCPFFIGNVPALATERGDRLSKFDVNLAGKFLVLVKPDCHVSTRNAYAGINPVAPTTDLVEAIKTPVDHWRASIKNDFEPTVFKACPGIKKIKDDLYNLGAKFALMSGSGSAVYGIFDEAVDLKDHFAGKFYFSCRI